MHRFSNDKSTYLLFNDYKYVNLNKHIPELDNVYPMNATVNHGLFTNVTILDLHNNLHFIKLVWDHNYEPCFAYHKICKLNMNHISSIFCSRDNLLTSCSAINAVNYCKTNKILNIVVDNYLLLTNGIHIFPYKKPHIYKYYNVTNYVVTNQQLFIEKTNNNVLDIYHIDNHYKEQHLLKLNNNFERISNFYINFKNQVMYEIDRIRQQIIKYNINIASGVDSITMVHRYGVTIYVKYINGNILKYILGIKKNQLNWSEFKNYKLKQKKFVCNINESGIFYEEYYFTKDRSYNLNKNTCSSFSHPISNYYNSNNMIKYDLPKFSPLLYGSLDYYDREKIYMLLVCNKITRKISSKYLLYDIILMIFF